MAGQRPATRRRKRATLVCLMTATALLSFATSASASRPLVANCGSLGFLTFKPHYWSAGCTSGSPTLNHLKWSRYIGRHASAKGTAVVLDCGCYDPTYVRRYPGSLRLSRPKRCREGIHVRYFSRVVLTIDYPRGNPFGKKPGKDSEIFHAPPGECGRP